MTFKWIQLLWHARLLVPLSTQAKLVRFSILNIQAEEELEKKRATSSTKLWTSGCSSHWHPLKWSIYLVMIQGMLVDYFVII